MKQQQQNTGTESKPVRSIAWGETITITNHEGITCFVNPSGNHNSGIPSKEDSETAKKIVSALNTNEKLQEQNRVLLGIAKQVAFVFGNEAHYPEGTMGYRMAKEATEAINKAKTNK